MMSWLTKGGRGLYHMLIITYKEGGEVGQLLMVTDKGYRQTWNLSQTLQGLSFG